ncbi:MAG TPA: LysR family transcriptional regulator [Pseudonocardia sp.]|nr:LysR family transcriptional regulator [Pseudonocardia sp.]
MTTNARLRALVELADTGSVRAAAQRLVVTEASVSGAISALAAEVGVPLLDRDGRGVRLTAAGLRYVGYARRILGLHEEALAAARGEADPAHGTLRLAAVTTAGEHLLPSLLASFRAAYPAVVLGLEVAPRQAVWPKLANHEVDLVVAGRPPSGGPARVRAVRPNSLVVVGPPSAAAGFEGGPLPAASEVGAADPAGSEPAGSKPAGSEPAGSEPAAFEPAAFDPATATWLLREPESGIRATTTALLSALEIVPPQLTLGSHGAVVAAAVAGLGVTLVSRPAVRAHLDSGALVELAVPGTPLQRPWHVVSQPAPTATTELFVRHLLAHRELGWRAPGARADRSAPGSVSEPSNVSDSGLHTL